MDAATRHAVDLMTGTSLTRAPADNVRGVLAIRAARPEDRDEVRRMVLRKRRAWLDWLSVTQRRWQLETRRPSRARHHDSIEIRERYVRAS